MAVTSRTGRVQAAGSGRPRAASSEGSSSSAQAAAAQTWVAPTVSVTSAEEVDVELGKSPTASSTARNATMAESRSHAEPTNSRLLQLPARATALCAAPVDGERSSSMPPGRGRSPLSNESIEGMTRGSSMPPRARGDVAPSPRRSSPTAAPRSPGNMLPRSTTACSNSRPRGGAALPHGAIRRGFRNRTRSHGVFSGSIGVMSVGTVAGWSAHAGYYVLAFFAYWFGAARFDMNGDGEFDPTDVQRMINNFSRHMRFSFSRPRPRGRRLRERLREQRNRQRRDAAEARQRDRIHEENMQQIRNAMEQEQADGPVQRPSVTSNPVVQLYVERGAYNLQRVADVAQTAIEAPVEGECVEHTVGDNLRQFWPWFSVSQILICFGLWLGYALRTHVYTVGASHALFDETIVIDRLTDISFYECQIECSSRGDACAGVAVREGLRPECQLLSEQPRDLQTIPRCQSQGSWNWIIYEKQPRSIGSLLVTMGGLETAFPGATSLQSGFYCEDGFRSSVFWRLLEYQFTHGGFAHVGGNCLLIFFLGVPLEGFHGTGLTALMYTMGVVGGGMAWMLLDPYTKVFGASGGCYALLGMQLADLVLNWSHKKFRYPMLIMLAVLVATETAGYASAIQGAMTTTAHAVHLGGLVSGFVIGMLLTYNIDKKCWERALQGMALLVGLGLVCFAMLYWFGNPFPGIRSLFNMDQEPFCWIGQVCTNEDGTGCDYIRGWQCVTCDTRECVEDWYKDEYVFCVALGNRNVCGDRFEDVVHNCVNC